MGGIGSLRINKGEHISEQALNLIYVSEGEDLFSHNFPPDNRLL